MSTMVDRMMQRTEEYGSIQNLNSRYNLSLAAAEKLSEELTEKYFSSNDRLNDGEQGYTALDNEIFMTLDPEFPINVKQ